MQKLKVGMILATLQAINVELSSNDEGVLTEIPVGTRCRVETVFQDPQSKKATAHLIYAHFDQFGEQINLCHIVGDMEETHEAAELQFDATLIGYSIKNLVHTTDGETFDLMYNDALVAKVSQSENDLVVDLQHGDVKDHYSKLIQQLEEITKDALPEWLTVESELMKYFANEHHLGFMTFLSYVELNNALDDAIM